MKNEPKSYVFTVDATPELVEKMRDDLSCKGYTFSTLAYAHFSAKADGVSCTLYTSGKLVIQGKKCKELIEFYIEPEILKCIGITCELVDKTPRIGCDEAGKGDFFGPLVIAAAYVEPSTIVQLIDLGVTDSKKLSDPKIMKMSAEIKKIIPHEIVRISPHKYNELYANFQNLNSLLAWGHATAMQALIAKTNCTNVLVDQFANEYVLERAVKLKKLDITLTQRTKGESDIAVAAASILARAGFVEGIEALEKQFGALLPKGASQAVILAGKEFVAKQGRDDLRYVAKLHFTTAQTVLRE